MKGSLRTTTRITLALVPLTYVLLVFGSTVRANGAGLACPDWPLCFGEVVPVLDFGVFLEWGHRVLAGFVSLVWLGIGAMLVQLDVPRRIKGLYLFGSGLLLSQVILGGLTVLHLLAEWTVAGHLICGNSFALVMLLLGLSLRELEAPVRRDPVSPVQRIWATRVAVLLAAQLLLGGYVAGSHAGLACGTWPSCNGAGWFPTLQGLVGLQVLHRITAYGLLAAALITSFVTRRSQRTGSAAMMVLSLVVIQAILGIANVLFQMPVEVTVAHSAGADALVLAVTYLNYEAWRAPALASISAPIGHHAPLEAK